MRDETMDNIELIGGKGGHHAEIDREVPGVTNPLVIPADNLRAYLIPC